MSLPEPRGPFAPEAPDWYEVHRRQGIRLRHAVAFTTGSLTFYALGDVVEGPTHAVIRAEEIALSAEPSMSSVQNQFRGKIREIVPAGALTRVTVDASGTPIVACSHGAIGS